MGSCTYVTAGICSTRRLKRSSLLSSAFWALSRSLLTSVSLSSRSMAGQSLLMFSLVR
jgi:hypothetical protein